MKIEHAQSDEQIAATFQVMRQLRSHLVEEEYVPQIRALMASDGFRLAFLADEGELQLISRVTREQAHRFYFREGLGIECFQFRTSLKD